MDSIGRSQASPRPRNTPWYSESVWSFGWACSRGRLVWTVIQVIAVAVLVTALVFESERTALVLAVFAIGAMVGCPNRATPYRCLLVGALFLLVLYFGVSQFASGSDTQTTATNSASALTTHLVSGPADPTGQQSTLPGHLSRVESGVAAGSPEPDRIWDGIHNACG